MKSLKNLCRKLKGRKKEILMVNIKKRMTAVLLVLVLLFISVATWKPRPAKAESIVNAKAYTLETKYSGMITENGDEKQYFKFTLPESGKIEITGSAYMYNVELYIYDENADELLKRDLYWNSTSEVISISESAYLTSGSYYFCVGKCGSNVGAFDFQIRFTAMGESFREGNGGSNNAMAVASNVKTDGTSYNAQIAVNDEKDFFKFTLQASGKVNFNATFYKMECVYWRLYDEQGVELLSRNPYWNRTTENIVVNEDLYLTNGTYYIAVNKDSNTYGKYTFSLPFTSSSEDYAETNGGSNNTVSTASTAVLGNNYRGQIAINDDRDFYKVTLSSSQTITIRVDAGMEELRVKLYDSSGNELKSWWCGKNNTTQKINFVETATLEKGNYYLAVVRDGYCGDYVLNISSLTKSNCPHESYDTKWYDSTYFSKGYRKYTCKLCGYTYKSDYTSVKKLSQGYFYSYCYAGKGKLYLSWSTVSDASGYQIRYSQNKKLKSGVITKTIKGQSKNKKTISKLKRKKRYYVQIRAYKKSGSKTVYGKWSVKKVLKTK